MVRKYQALVESNYRGNNLVDFTIFLGFECLAEIYGFLDPAVKLDHRQQVVMLPVLLVTYRAARMDPAEVLRDG